MKRGKMIGPIITGLAALASAVVLLAVSLNKDNFVIYNGISAYRTVCTVMTAVTGGLAVLFLIFLLAALKKERPKEAASPVKEKAPTLSVKEKLENESLRKMLAAEASGRWAELSPEINDTIEQMKKMDSYQEKLHSLLLNNDVKALSDTEEILEQAEQGLCQSVRRILNYMSVYDEKDVEALRATVQTTNRNIRAQLDQVRDFVVAVTDFVNQQGADVDPDMLNTYKTVILDSLKGDL